VFIGDLFFETNGAEADALEPALAAANGNGIFVIVGSNGERFKEAAVLAVNCVLFHGVCFIAFV
jgi:predicted nicotinamide N-methyase